MASNSQSATALLTEHFRFTPLTLLDEIINTVNELVFHAVNQLEKALSTASAEALGFELDTSEAAIDEEARRLALEDIKQNEINLGIVQIESLLNATVDKDFDKFEIYTLRNILAVGHDEDADLAQWVCLDHYRHLKLDDSAQRVTPEAVQLQRRKLHETAKLNAMLREEEARNKVVIEQLEAILGQGDGKTSSAQSASLAFLADRKTSQPLSAEMKHIVEQLPQLRQHVAHLQHSLAMPPTRNTRTEHDSAAIKRRAYLDSQTIKALNRQGIEADGTNSNSKIDLAKITEESVQGLEAIVSGFGGANAKQPEG